MGGKQFKLILQDSFWHTVDAQKTKGSYSKELCMQSSSSTRLYCPLVLSTVKAQRTRWRAPLGVFLSRLPKANTEKVQKIPQQSSSYNIHG